VHACGGLGKEAAGADELLWQIRNFVISCGLGGLFAEMTSTRSRDLLDQGRLAVRARHRRPRREQHRLRSNLDSLSIEWTFADGTKATTSCAGWRALPLEFATTSMERSALRSSTRTDCAKGNGLVCTRTNASTKDTIGLGDASRNDHSWMPSGTYCWTTSARTSRRRDQARGPTRMWRTSWRRPSIQGGDPVGRTLASTSSSVRTSTSWTTKTRPRPDRRPGTLPRARPRRDGRDLKEAAT